MPRAMRMLVKVLFALPVIGWTASLGAQDSDVPYWASIDVDKMHMRVGPATSYRIEWVYKREGLPLKVLRRGEGWRLVEDPDGARGWVLGQFLSRERSAIVIGEGLAEMRDKAGPEGRIAWRLEPGVVGRLGECSDGWCEFAVGRRKGVAPQARLWGAGAP